MSNFEDILFGAAIASIVPIVTLLINNSKWKTEKRIEHLRNKHERLERIYAEILNVLPDAISNNVYPSQMMSKISIYGSPEARKVFYDFMEDKEKDDQKNREVILNFSLAANEHLLRIENKIADALS